MIPPMPKGDWTHVLTVSDSVKEHVLAILQDLKVAHVCHPTEQWAIFANLTEEQIEDYLDYDSIFIATANEFETAWE